MQQFTALLKKEISGYFKGYFAYLVFALYLIASAGISLYFGAYMIMHDAAAFSLFYVQPYILLAFIPALTMKSWSDEYKSGTAEFLLTQPIADYKLVTAKVLAAFIAGVIMSLCLLPQIIYTATWLNLDKGNIICCFLGLWLLQFLFASLGCLLSSFSRHMIVSYIVSVFVMALFLLVTPLKLFETYGNFLFGEIGVSDVLYFVVSSGAFIWLNGQILLYRRSVQKHKTLKLCGFAVLLFFGVYLLLWLIGLIFSAKADLTSAGFYTPSSESAKIVSELKEPYLFDLYIARDYKMRNPEYYQYFEQIKRFLQKYEKLSQGMLKVTATEVEPYSELENIVMRNGLYYKANEKGSFDYIGAFLRNRQNNGVVIKNFITERRPYLEKDIDKALLKVSKPEILKTIGVYMNPTQNLDEFEGFMQNLEGDFNIFNVTTKTYEISPLMDMLILINPKNLPAHFIYAVDQYIVNGGKVLLFWDLLTENQSHVTNLEEVQISKLFNHWGIVPNDAFTDNAEPAAEFMIEKGNVKVNHALSFSVNNQMVDVEPILTDGDKYVGALLVGTMTSAYASNPFEGDKKVADMAEYTAVTLLPAQVAVIGDVDLIEDYLWADEKSVSKSPYGVIAKNKNIDFVRALIEKMLNIKEYAKLPVQKNMENPMNIAQQINAEAYAKYADEYDTVSKELKETQQVLLLESNGDEERLQTLLQTDEIGLQMAELEKKFEKTVYAMKKVYDESVYTIIFLSMLLFPLLSVCVFGLLFFLRARWLRKRIRGFFA